MNSDPPDEQTTAKKTRHVVPSERPSKTDFKSKKQEERPRR